MSVRNGMWQACGMKQLCGMQYLEMARRNKLNRKAYARLCRALFWHKLEGATALPVRLLLLAQTKKLEQRVGVYEDYGGNHF